MNKIIDNIDFYSLEVQKYWSFPSSYKGDKKLETKNMIMSGKYIGSRKYDGAFYKFIVDMNGNMILIGRSKGVSGEYIDKLDRVPHLNKFFKTLPQGTCLLGEIVFPTNEGSNKVTTIMGCLPDKAISRQNTIGYLSYYIFDVLAYDGISLLKQPIEERIKYIDKLPEDENIIKAKYYSGIYLWNELQSVLGQGGEGVVITKQNTLYQPGKRPSRQTLKVKKELKENADVFFTGHTSPPKREYTGKELETWKYWINSVTEEKFIATENDNIYKRYVEGEPIEPITKGYYYGWVGSLEVGVYNELGKVVPLGYLAGLPDEIKANPKNYYLQPFEMTAMQFTEDNAFRHGKFVKWRPDLSPADCTWEKIFGNKDNKDTIVINQKSILQNLTERIEASRNEKK